VRDQRDKQEAWPLARNSFTKLACKILLSCRRERFAFADEVARTLA